MSPKSIEESLEQAEAALDAGNDLKGTGFWQAVADVKRNPELVERYAERIAEIDRRAHKRWALLVVPLGLGTTLAIIATLAGLALIWLAYEVEGLTAVIVFFIGFGVVLVTTHGLAHLIVGRLQGMRFTSWFIARIQQPQPGVKLDYATYLGVPAARRAWMHAAGPITTKLIPFLLIGAAVAAGLPVWAVWLLPIVGLGAILTDVIWSTKKSDWKRFRREMSFAQDS